MEVINTKIFMLKFILFTIGFYVIAYALMVLFTFNAGAELADATCALFTPGCVALGVVEPEGGDAYFLRAWVNFALGAILMFSISSSLFWIIFPKSKRYLSKWLAPKLLFLTMSLCVFMIFLSFFFFSGSFDV